MPLHKLPKTLYNLSLEQTVNLITRSCQNIEEYFGNYEEEVCREQVEILQDQLLNKIPVLILEDVFNSIKNFGSLKDTRILFAVYMHKGVKRLGKPLRILSEKSGVSIKPKDQFWISQLAHLHDLLYLNLKLNCTDNILQVVGENCHQLEYINIISRMEPEALTGNALKIKYFVSDQGLEYLTSCTSLKIIEMNSVLRRNFEGKLTISGIRTLLKSLAFLEVVSFNHMGEVLATNMDDVDHLALRCLADFSAQPTHMSAITRLCPNLKEITLHSPIHENSTFGNNLTLRIFANSNLEVSCITLMNFDVTDEMRSLFQYKGCHISSLLLDIPTSLSIKDIELIGITCSNITLLSLLNISRPRSMDNIQTISSNNHLFERLEMLTITGQDWDETLLEILLTHALSITLLYLHKRAMTSANNEALLVLLNITTKNPMDKINNLTLFLSESIDLQTVKYFLKICPLLSSFHFDFTDPSLADDFLKLQEEINDTNLELDLCYGLI